MPVIVRKGGRFGNFLVRIVKALYLAEKLDCARVIIKTQNPLLRKSEITLRPDKNNLQDPLVDEDDAYDFFYLPQFEVKRIRELYPELTSNFGCNLAESRRLASQYNLLDIFTFSDLYNNMAAQRPPRDLVLHIRSGDIMQPNPHRGYVQYPKYFVEHVLALEGVAHSTLVNSTYEDGVVAQIEDNMNPVAQWWIESGYPHNDLTSSLQHAIVAIMHTRCIAKGTGTFANISAILSPVLQKIYVMQVTKSIASTNETGVITKEGVVPSVYAVPLPGYIAKSAWTASNEQKKFMLTYRPMDDENCCRALERSPAQSAASQGE